ncbi:hypothetical protein [Sphingomonas sp. Leaf25]|uniref:hypothetical protein n=1 Tax=Sphingomonas sp. Leaf25 TaxID=1735692 RepID=UPI0012E10117|nr:hypothetical protein [Sphingomonas sp. Leaf25]
MSLAINTLARGVAADQVDLLDETFKTPTPFTERAYRIEAATKAKPSALVAAKDIQAQYLAPYVFGGNRFLGRKRGMLAPRGIALNQYGNLPRNKLASLKSKRGIVIGPIKTKAGKTISGVWQRPVAAKKPRGKRGTGPQPRTGLKLLIAFEDTKAVPKRLPFEKRARAYLARHSAAAFTDALQRALSTARR